MLPWKPDALGFHPDQPKDAAGVRQLHRSVSITFLLILFLTQGLSAQLWLFWQTHYVDQAVLELTEKHLPLHPACWVSQIGFHCCEEHHDQGNSSKGKH